MEELVPEAPWIGYSHFEPDECGAQNDQPLEESDIVGPARAAITESLSGPLANDLPYTPYTDATLQRLADLAPATLAVMHGSSYRGDGQTALQDLAVTLRELLGPERAG